MFFLQLCSGMQTTPGLLCPALPSAPISTVAGMWVARNTSVSLSISEARNAMALNWRGLADLMDAQASLLSDPK